MFEVLSVPVEEIVDFEEQVTAFRDMLYGVRNEQIMIISTPGKTGKSCLLRLFHDMCSRLDVPCSYVNFRGSIPAPHPHYSLPKELFVKWQIRYEEFRSVLRQIPEFGSVTESRGIHVEGQTADIQAGDVAAGHIIKDSVIIQLSREQDRLLSERWLKENLIQASLIDISKMIDQKGKAVCLFDTFEEVGPDEERWIIDHLLTPIKESRLKNLFVVIAGKDRPDLPLYWEWTRIMIQFNALPTMTKDAIKEYARRIGVLLTDEYADLCWRASCGGQPFFMGMFIKNLAMLKDRD